MLQGMKYILERISIYFGVLDVSNCTRWIDKIISISWKESKVIYRSSPMLILPRSIIKVNIKAVSGRWNCKALFCDGSFKTTIKITNVELLTSFENDIIFKVTDLNAYGQKTFEINIPYSGTYVIEIEVNTTESYDALVKAQLTVDICR